MLCIKQEEKCIVLGKLSVGHVIELLTLKRSFSSLFLQIYISELCGGKIEFNCLNVIVFLLLSVFQPKVTVEGVGYFS